MTSFLLAPLRCLVLVALTAVGAVVAQLGVAIVALVVPYPLVLWADRRLAELGRRLAWRWGGVPIPSSYPDPPPDPVRRPDGWYEHDKQLYRHPHVPRWLRRTEALGDDSTVLRDWLWLALTPLAGGLVVAAPVAVIAGGVVVAVSSSTAVGLVAGAALVLAGFGGAPAALRGYALWNRVLLQPVAQSWWRRSGFGAVVTRSWRALWHGAGLAGLALGAFGLGLATLVVAVVSWGALLPWAMGLIRPYLDYYRRRCEAWTGTRIDPPYRPQPPLDRQADGRYRVGRTLYDSEQSAVAAQKYVLVLQDPATWRDLLWMLTAPVVSAGPLALAGAAGIGVFGLACQPVWWGVWAIPVGLIDGVWVTPFFLWHGLTLVNPALAVVPDWASTLIGLAAAAVAGVLARPLLRLRTAWDRLLLAPTRRALLAHRVRQLTESRSDAIDAQAAELRRIERDLHDGAQARLVALGLSLATAEQLLERDPAAARALLAQAREASTTALTELRDLVRGIHPPVLAERGLVDAIRAVALDSPLPVTVAADVGGRLPAPVESAVYFAVTEALANATRHAGASHITVELRHDGQRLHIIVTDDGRGGADPAKGTGLAGIRRRLGTFDGTMTVTSPPGGPTVLRMEVPCEFSSPRTSTS